MKRRDVRRDMTADEAQGEYNAAVDEARVAEEVMAEKLDPESASTADVA